MQKGHPCVGCRTNEKDKSKMGMAASQARLLTITSRIHDVEYQAQSIQNAKIALATQSDEVYKDYLNALDQTTLTVRDNNSQLVVANFNTLCGINAAKANINERYLLRDDRGRIVVDKEIADGYKNGKDKVNNAYEFAMYMIEGQPSDFNVENYREAENEQLENNLPSNLTSMRDNLVDQMYQIYKDLLEVDETFSPIIEGEEGDEKTQKQYLKNDIKGYVATFTTMYDNYKKNLSSDPTAYEEKLGEADKKISESLDKLSATLEEFEYNLYKSKAEDIYEGVNGSTIDYNSADFWYYVNMYKQLEANGGSYVEISEFDGIDGVGNAATDSDWLKNAIQSGKITVDISNINNKGQISFQSTGVPSDTALDYTTTTTIDKSYYAKVEAEYEYKTKKLNEKDKKYDMDLSKLETERNALTTEYDSVKKVVEDNVKRTFGIFS